MKADRTRGPRALLAERDFRSLLVSQYLAQAADGAAQAALADVLILEPSAGETPERLFGVFVLTLLPYSLIAPFLGVFVDRWPRRTVLVWTGLIRALLLASLPLWWNEVATDAPLYVAALALLGFGRLFLTTKGAALPFVLHDRDLLAGNALSSGGGMIAALIGGMLGIASAGQLGSDATLVAAGAIYAGSAVIARRLSDPMAHQPSHVERLLVAVARVGRELVDGIRQVLGRPRARLPLMGIGIMRVAVMLTVLSAILIIKDVYPNAPDRFGRLSASALALGMAGVGAFIGACSTPFLGRRLDKPRLVLVGFFVSGSGIAALGGIEVLAVVMVLTAIGGLGTFIAKVAVDALVQEAMPDDYRGRAFALYDILYNVASVVAAFLLFAFADMSLRRLLVGAGLGCLLLSGLLGRAMKRAGMLS